MWKRDKWWVNLLQWLEKRRNKTTSFMSFDKSEASKFLISLFLDLVLWLQCLLIFIWSPPIPNIDGTLCEYVCGLLLLLLFFLLTWKFSSIYFIHDFFGRELLIPFFLSSSRIIEFTCSSHSFPFGESCSIGSLEI